MPSSKMVIEGQSELSSRIALWRPRFNASRNRIADFLLKDEKAVLNLSIYEIASQIGVSVATITRFCQLLGYDGLTDMKFHMQQQAVSLNDDIGIQKNDSINVAKQKALQFIETSLHNCMMDLDNTSLEQAVDLVGNAGRILLCGTGSAGGIAQSCAALFMSMGFSAFTEPDYLIQLRSAAALGSSDLLIAISYDGRTKATGDAMMLAKSHSANVILITSTRKSLLTRYADLIFYTPARAGGNAMNITATSLCQMSIIHMLALGALTKHYDRFGKQSCEQLQLSELGRYDDKQKEILLTKTEPSI